MCLKNQLSLLSEVLSCSLPVPQFDFGQTLNHVWTSFDRLSPETYGQVHRQPGVVVGVTWYEGCGCWVYFLYFDESYLCPRGVTIDPIPESELEFLG